MVAAGIGIGVALDDWWHSSPICTLVGLAFGLVAGIGNTVYKVRRFL